MKKLLTLIEEQLRKVNTIVTCPVCGKRQLFELDNLSKIRLGNEAMYTGTGGMPMVQCEHCKAEGKTTLIRLNERFYNEIAGIVVKALYEQPVKYVDARYEDTTICVSE